MGIDQVEELEQREIGVGNPQPLIWDEVKCSMSDLLYAVRAVVRGIEAELRFSNERTVVLIPADEDEESNLPLAIRCINGAKVHAKFETLPSLMDLLSSYAPGVSLEQISVLVHQYFHDVPEIAEAV